VRRNVICLDHTQILRLLSYRATPSAGGSITDLSISRLIFQAEEGCSQLDADIRKTPIFQNALLWKIVGGIGAVMATATMFVPLLNASSGLACGSNAFAAEPNFNSKIPYAFILWVSALTTFGLAGAFLGGLAAKICGALLANKAFLFVQYNTSQLGMRWVNIVFLLALIGLIFAARASIGHAFCLTPQGISGSSIENSVRTSSRSMIGWNHVRSADTSCEVSISKGHRIWEESFFLTLDSGDVVPIELGICRQTIIRGLARYLPIQHLTYDDREVAVGCPYPSFRDLIEGRYNKKRF
jgi:hypothetical protein